jgi:hypothetical protein
MAAICHERDNFRLSFFVQCGVAHDAAAADIDARQLELRFDLGKHESRRS